MKTTKVNMQLECRLTEAELKESSKRLAEAINQKGIVEGRIEEFKTQAKADLAALDATIARNTQLVSSEREYRMIEVTCEWDFKRGIKTFYRIDTGEIVKTVAITEDERQLDIEDLQPAGKKN